MILCFVAKVNLFLALFTSVLYAARRKDATNIQYAFCRRSQEARKGSQQEESGKAELRR